MTNTLPYLEFQTAIARHQQPLSQLPEEAQSEIRRDASRQWKLEERILKSPEALRCPADPACVAQALETIRARYADRGSYLADLAANGLDEALLTEALARELRVEAVLALVTSSVPKVTAQDAEIFYWQHRARFEISEARQTRHILITINEDLASNRRAEALARINAVAAILAADLSAFADQAMRHSECPTAMSGGELGWVTRGQLYPELDAVLCEMHAGQLSAAVESPLGFHLLYCEAVREASFHDFAEVADKLVESLQKRRDKQAHTEWLKALKPA
ncbi:MAG: nitrogen fixation protein NifM [Formivibrio sp.]|nr:nitrogen fixation protein NifM [Formivibrio sp.]